MVFLFLFFCFMSSSLCLCLLSKPFSETFSAAKHFNTINLSESVPRSLCLTRSYFSFSQSSYSGQSFTLVWLLSFSLGHWNKARPTLQQPWNVFFTTLAVVQGIIEIPQLMEQELLKLFNFTNLSSENNITKITLQACKNFASPYFSTIFPCTMQNWTHTVPLVGARDHRGVMQWWGRRIQFPPTQPSLKNNNWIVR